MKKVAVLTSSVRHFKSWVLENEKLDEEYIMILRLEDAQGHYFHKVEYSYLWWEGMKNAGTVELTCKRRLIEETGQKPV